MLFFGWWGVHGYHVNQTRTEKVKSSTKMSIICLEKCEVKQKEIELRSMNKAKFHVQC